MRFWSLLRSMFRRAAPVHTTWDSVLLLEGSPAVQSYDTLTSMSSVARFPWIRVCVQAVAGDASALPLVAIKTDADGERKVIHDPILDLISRPSPGTTGHLLRKQLWQDYLLTGNAYIWRPSPNLMLRLHPATVVPIVNGPMVSVYRVTDPTTGIVQNIPPSQVLHIRDTSWSDDPSRFLGDSPIQALNDDLQTELGSKKLASKQAQKGKPDIVLSTKEPLGDVMAQKLKDRWTAATLSLDGAFVTGADVTATKMSWSPSEFQFKEQSEITRATILAIFGVPPTRAGLPTANYGTGKQEVRVYWENVRSRAVAFDDAFSLWAAPGVHIEHDMSGLEALQASKTELINTIGVLISYGATPKAAAAYLGLDDCPLPDEAPAEFKRPVNIDKRPEEPQGDGKALRLVAP